MVNGLIWDQEFEDPEEDTEQARSMGYEHHVYRK